MTCTKPVEKEGENVAPNVKCAIIVHPPPPYFYSILKICLLQFSSIKYGINTEIPIALLLSSNQLVCPPQLRTTNAQSSNWETTNNLHYYQLRYQKLRHELKPATEHGNNLIPLNIFI